MTSTSQAASRLPLPFTYLLLLLLALASCSAGATTPAATELGAMTATNKPASEGGRNSPGSAWEWRHKTMVNEHGKIPHGAKIQAIQFRRDMENTDFENGGIQPGSWTWLGPGNVGGRCRGMWIQPSDPDVLVLGSCGGGVWRSTNAGASWAPVSDFPACLTVSCIAAPKGSNNVVWAGTGEGFKGTQSLRGTGIYRSLDSGRTFTHLAGTGTSTFYFVNRIAFCPTNANIVYAATNTGLWRTTNATATTPTWTRYRSTVWLDVKFHPTNGNRAVAGGMSGSRLMYSTNASAANPTWTTPTGLPSAFRRAELAYAPSNPTRIYAQLDISSTEGRVYRSTDGGATWGLRGRHSIMKKQGWYNNAIWVDPTDSEMLVVGGVGLARSTDGGRTFADIRDIHADQHLILHHPNFNATTNRTVYVCNDGGIYRADDIDLATTNSGWTDLNNGLGITQFYGGDVSPSGITFGGTQDNGTQVQVNTVTKEYSLLRSADGMKAEADPTDPNYLYGEIQFSGVFRSINGGVSHEKIANNLTDAGDDTGPWIGALRLDPNDTNRLWLGAKQLWRTNNVKTANPAAVFWTAVGNSPDNYSSVDVARGNSSIVVAATETGSVYRSTNAGALIPLWTKIDTNSLPDRYITSIRIAPLNTSHIYVTFAGYSDDNLWYTTNNGTSWQDISGSGANGLPSAPFRTLAIHPRNLGWLYVGTEVGVFASTDNGQNWSASNDGPATVPVDEIRIKNSGSIYAFTYGRGIYRAHAGTNRDPGAKTVRASITWTQGQSNGSSFVPSISGNGRIVAFSSDATNLGLGDNNGVRDVFIRDRQSGLMLLQSMNTAGSKGNGTSDRPDISTDARFIAFQSTATNLVSRDSNSARDIFVRDRTHTTTERISQSTSGVQANDSSRSASINSDGRYVVFTSSASNLTPQDSNGVADIFLRDRHKGTTTRVNSSSKVAQANGNSSNTSQAISANGLYIVFASSATNLVTGDTNNESDIFLRQNIGLLSTLTRINIGLFGAQTNAGSFAPTISADGRYVTYYSLASNLVRSDNNGKYDVFLYDRVSKSTKLLSKGLSSISGDGDSRLPTISDDGNTVVFDSFAEDLVQGDSNGKRDVFVWTRAADAVQRVSVDSARRQALELSISGVPSSDGRYIAFASDAFNLVNNDTNSSRDIFVHEPQTSSTVFPILATHLPGSTLTGYPFSRSDMRLQQSARESNRMMVISRLAFRRNNQANTTNAGYRNIDLDLKMGSSDIDQMTTTFNMNWYGAPQYVVTRKQFRLPSWNAATGGLQRFDASIPLDRPYMHTGTRQLLWETSVYDNNSTGFYPLDAHAGNLTLTSTSSVVGTGCPTNTSREFAHSFSFSSDGPTYNIGIGASGAPANAAVSCAFGFSNPNFSLGLCTLLHTDASVIFPIGQANNQGVVAANIPSGPWDPGFRGAVVHSQLLSITNKAHLSHGRRTVLPTTNPGPLMRRVFALTRSSGAGTLQNYGAVFKLENY